MEKEGSFIDPQQNQLYSAGDVICGSPQKLDNLPP